MASIGAHDKHAKTRHARSQLHVRGIAAKATAIAKRYTQTERTCERAHLSPDGPACRRARCLSLKK
eukprot:2507259-Alexandrium_andersonii.AAC.1